MNPNDQTSIVFNIQKFSLHDGPGIRTVVFLKGCPLKCKWCANPESQSPRIQILWDKEKCLGCGACAASCPQGAVLKTGRIIRIDGKTCSGCGICAAGCPAQALKAEGKVKAVREVLNVCLQDRDFYEESGGGVTLSGGEALVHPDFSMALADALQKQNIHVAMETTGFAAPGLFDRVTGHMDLLLFDVKHWDEAKHLEGTGVSNRLILDNMKRAIASGMRVLPRLPVIPGYNNTLADAKGFAARLKEAGACEIQLLPFHQFGEKKYDELGKPYAYTDVPALHEEDLKDFRQVLLDQGIRAFF